MRSCIKPGCRWPAVATLSYRYATAEVWLADLGERHPATHDLCPHHADDMRVPRGWSLVDDRRPVEAVREPSAAELVLRNTKLRSNVDAILMVPPAPRTSRSRYADLLDNLPTYDPPEGEEEDGAAKVTVDAAVADDVAAEIEPPPPPAQDDRPAPSLVAVGVAHELAPVLLDRRPTARPTSGSGPDHRPDRDAVHHAVHHPTGIRGAIVVQLPLRTEDDDEI